MPRKHRNKPDSSNELFDRLSETSAKTHNVMLIAQSLAENGEKLLAEIAEKSDCWYEEDGVSLSKLEGMVERRIVPFVKDMKLHLSVIVKNFHEIVETQKQLEQVLKEVDKENVYKGETPHSPDDSESTSNKENKDDSVQEMQKGQGT